MTCIQDVFEELCRLAPLELQMDFDNAGFQIGRADREVHRVLLALDVTDTVTEEAHEIGAELIVSHHPLIFSPLKAVNNTSPVQNRVLMLAENRIGLISMHTNLDIARGGVNDVLIRLLGAEPEDVLDPDGCGRIGTLPFPMELDRFLALCKDRLHVHTLRYCTGGRPVSKLAVMGGAGAGSVEEAAAKGCDTYLTADIKYHQFQHAAELGLNLIDADHFYTENPVIPALAKRLADVFPDVEFRVSAKHTACVHFA
jgi:dinuclear metal center protein, YbgI/SA1388 family